MMMTKRISIFPMLLGLVFVAAAAQAATLFTPPLVPLGTNQLDCYLVNVSDQIRTATLVRSSTLSRLHSIREKKKWRRSWRARSPGTASSSSTVAAFTSGALC
jgi:hypothetical protein